jgi:hypothetical protein
MQRGTTCNALCVRIERAVIDLLLRSKVNGELYLFDLHDAHLPNEADDPRSTSLKASAVMSLVETHWRGWRLPALNVDT